MRTRSTSTEITVYLCVWEREGWFVHHLGDVEAASMGGLTDIYDLPGFTPSPQHLQHIRKIQKKKDGSGHGQRMEFLGCSSFSLMARSAGDHGNTWDPNTCSSRPSSWPWTQRRWRIGRGGSRATRGCRRRCGRARPPPRAVGAERGSTRACVTWS